MILFPTGINITDVEHKELLHVTTAPEQWVRDTLTDKVTLRRAALVKEWLPRLLMDTDITELPVTLEDCLQTIFSHPAYKNRAQRDAAQVPPELTYLHNIARFEGTVKHGVVRVPRDATITLIPEGIHILDLDLTCLLYYLQNVSDWVLGALLGQINRGKKKIINQYTPVFIANPTITRVPASEEGLINMIVALPEYETIPQQVDRIRASQP